MFVPKGPIYNKSALVQVMAWHLLGAKPFWTNADPVDWRIYAALGGDELINVRGTTAGLDVKYTTSLYTGVSIYAIQHNILHFKYQIN